MLTKGIVEEVVSQYQVKVRLPIFNKSKDAIGATPKEELSDAIICTLPNSILGLQVGDIVIVGFEDNNTNKPIVLGCLSVDTKSTSGSGLILSSLQVNLDTQLSKDTHIGEITPEEIQSLSKIKSNIQWQLDVLNQKIDSSSGAPEEYIKSAEVNNNTLTLIDQNDDEIVFTPSGTSGVSSVNNKTGIVTLYGTDIELSNSDNTTLDDAIAITNSNVSTVGLTGNAITGLAITNKQLVATGTTTFAALDNNNKLNYNNIPDVVKHSLAYGGTIRGINTSSYFTVLLSIDGQTKLNTTNETIQISDSNKSNTVGLFFIISDLINVENLESFTGLNNIKYYNILYCAAESNMGTPEYMWKILRTADDLYATDIQMYEGSGVTINDYVEAKSNKVTSISSASTDTQYPSAKCVYDLVGDIESLLASI